MNPTPMAVLLFVMQLFHSSPNLGAVPKQLNSFFHTTPQPLVKQSRAAVPNEANCVTETRTKTTCKYIKGAQNAVF